MICTTMIARGLLAASIFYDNSCAQALNITNIQVQSPPGSHLSLQPLLHDTRLLGQRSTLSIIWSSLATIFACTWASVHMNVPPTSDSDWKVLKRRFKIMVYMLLLPELIIYWASKQWYGARKAARKHSSHGWTMTHGFFVGMGGFVLYENGKVVRPLDIDELEDASEMAEIDWPQTSEDDILDKSKGDYFTKGVVILQATWFIFQCTARWAMGLAITELEVVTLGFAALSGVMCFFWLKKPLDVRRPVPIVGRGPSWKISNVSGTKRKEGAEQFGKPSPRIEIEDRHILHNNNPALDILNDNSQYPTYSPTQSVQGHLTPLAIFPNPPPDVLILDDGYNQHYTPHQTVTNALPATCLTTENDTIHDHIPTQTIDVRKNVINTRRLMLATLLAPFQTLISDMFELKDSGALIAQDSKTGDSCHMSTFYAAVRLPIDHRLSLFLFVAGTIFGGIHCIAWANHFPTRIEEWAWKASALSVTILPSLLAMHWITISWYDYAPTSQSFNISISGVVGLVKYVFFITSSLRLGLMFSVYVVARIFLLVLPFISLRALPTSAYVEISWTNVLPHV